MAAAGESGVVFAGANTGGYIFPDFVCGYDAVMSVMRLLELLAPHEEPVSELLADLPMSTLVHKTIACPWALKGTVMRTLTEELQQTTDQEVGLLDGIRVTTDTNWVQVLPDADEPLFHVFAEAGSALDSAAAADDFVARVREIIDRGGT